MSEHTSSRLTNDVELGLAGNLHESELPSLIQTLNAPHIWKPNSQLESRNGSMSDMARLFPPASPLLTPSGLTSPTLSVTDMSATFEDQKSLPGYMSRPNSPSSQIFEDKKPSNASQISPEALVPLPRPSKDALPTKKKEASWWIRTSIWYNTYRKFFTTVVLFNALGLILSLTGQFSYARQYPGAMVLGNFTAAILVRNELFGRLLYLVINTMFAKWTPLWLRLGCTSVLQHLGGIHSGCAVSGCAWLILNVIDVFIHHWQHHWSILATSITTCVAIVVSILSAFPWVRNNHHNVFERHHRFVGWVGLGSTWAFVLLGDLWDSTNRSFSPTPMRVFGSQAFWFILCMTIFVALPWCFVRKVPVEIEIPSPKVAVLKFERGMQQGLLGRISRSALKEYHAFGIISAGTDSKQHYMICGVQGDFTRSLVNDPPAFLWTRQLKFAGVSNTSTLYKRGIRICTGTGLGAALSTCIQSPNWFLIWIGSDIEKTFGPTISALIHENLGEDRVLLWDSKARGGRPNTMKILQEVYRIWNAEVVFITSNYEGNKEMMEGCKEAGIPAFGTLWDF